VKLPSNSENASGIQDSIEKKLMEYQRILRMEDQRLPKKSMIFAQQLGSSNLLYEAHTIFNKHNITYRL